MSSGQRSGGRQEAAPPRYHRNPVTGLFERVPSSASVNSGMPGARQGPQEVMSRGESLGARGGSSPALVQSAESSRNNNYGSSSNASSDRRPGPRNVSASSYDDMLKNLDAMVTEQQTQPMMASGYNSSRRPSQPLPSSSQRSFSRGGGSSVGSSLDFGQMDASLDNMLRGSSSQLPPGAIPARTVPPTRAGISPRGESRGSPRSHGNVSEYAPSPSVSSTARAPASRMDQSRIESPVSLDLESLRGSRSSRSRPFGDPSEMAEERETERLRRDHDRLERDRRAVELLEAQQVAQRRAMCDPSSISSTASMSGPLGDADVMDDRDIPIDYIQALRAALKADPSMTPVPEDFLIPDGFYIWQQNVGIRIQEALSDILNSRYIVARAEARSRGPALSLPLPIKLRIVEAKDLLTKENRMRDPFCHIEFGNLDKRKDRGTKLFEEFSTQIVNDTLTPRWNQHVDLDVRQWEDKLSLEVWDKRKDQFLGRVLISISDIINLLETEGTVSNWFRLERHPKHKDKYVGGEIFLEFHCERAETMAHERDSRRKRDMEEFLMGSRMSMRSLFGYLMKAVILLDVRTRGKQDKGESILSMESKSLLRAFAKKWRLSEPSQILSYIELLFQYYQQDKLSLVHVLQAYDYMRERQKEPHWFNESEEECLLAILITMYAHFESQVTKYKDYFPKNRPSGALDNTILMLRLIYRNQVYVVVHPNREKSFTQHLRNLMSENAIAKYESFKEITSPFDKNDLDAVIDGLIRLAEMMRDDITADVDYYRKPFQREFDIARLSAETYLKYYGLTMESNILIFSQEGTVQNSSKQVFALYKKLKSIERGYAKIVSGLKQSSGNSIGFDVERWFFPFLLSWLNHLESKTIEWVGNAIKIDKFEIDESEIASDAPTANLCSSSITDVFSAIYQQLDFIADLKWADSYQNAKFLQQFTKIINKAIEQYCDAVAVVDAKPDNPIGFAGLQDMLTGGKVTSAPQDIAKEFCTKLCNLDFAIRKLDDIYRLMNVSRVKSTIKAYNMSSSVQEAPTTPDGKFSGMLKIEVLLAENVKACTSAGSANPYVILKLGDDKTSKDQRRSSIGSVNSHASQSLSSLATGFIGNKNELLRTRVVNDSLNPMWGETFELLLPRVDKLSAFVYSKNIISADDLAGQGSIDLSSESSLQRRLLNHQTHKVTVDLAPQGALVLRITHDGVVEDVDFWFRKTKERLKRTRNDFFRVIVSRVSPYTKAMILKAVKDQEAVAEPSKSFFSLATTTQLTDNTASGASVNSNMTETEADEAIFPLTDYLNKNFEVLCVSLPTRMAQESIRRIWDELLLIIEYTLIPPLFGPIEKERRLFNPRQLSLISITLGILRDFFHADGEGLGIPILSLETNKYLDIQTVLSRYTTDLDRLKRECELGIESGRDKEVVLRLVRVLFEKDEKKTSQDKETQRTWLNTQIEKRKRTDN